MRYRGRNVWWVAGLLGCAPSNEADSETGGSSSDATGDAADVATATSMGPTDGSEATTSDMASETGDASESSTGEPFSFEFHTELVSGRLVLRTDLPFDTEVCLGLAGAPCEDLDADGLVDVWEDAVIERLRPLRRMDEDEEFVGDATAAAGDVGRVAWAPDATNVRAYVMLGWSHDYGSCGFTEHNGDSERIALDLEPWPEGGAGGVMVATAYTAAHEGTGNDHGRVFAGPDLNQLVYANDPTYAEARWVVFPSANKHATYASLAICEGVSSIPCLEEDCGPDGVSRPSAYDLLPPFINAGELEFPLADDLSVVGFPGDSAWDDRPFCGGLGGEGCSSPVRDKLLVDPFE